MSDAQPAAEIAVNFLLDESTLILFGWMTQTPPAAGTLVFDDGGESGTFRALSWPRQGGEDTHWFIAVLRIAHIGQVKTTRPILVADGARLTLPEPPRIQLDPAALFETVKSRAPDVGPVAFEFLRAAFADASFVPPSQRVVRFLFAFLQSISQPDGFVELFGALDGAGLMLQGWSFHMGAGEIDIIVEAGNFHASRAAVASFARADLSSAARGVMALMDDGGLIDPLAIRRVFFRRDKGFFYLDMFEKRSVLPQAEALGHLKSMLPSLRFDPANARRFRRAAAARFTGAETISTLTAPVRAALDTVAYVPEAGMYLTGWLLDPARLVAEVALRSTTGFHTRIDHVWARLARPDVNAGYAQDPLLAPYLKPDDAMHGYLAFVPCKVTDPAGEHFYLEVTLTNDDSAHLPVAGAARPSAALVRRILGSFNPDDPAAERVVNRHVGPIVAASLRALPSAAEGARVVAEFGAIKSPRFSVILALGEANGDVDINLARLAADPDFAQAEIIATCPESCVPRIGALVHRYARYYGLAGRLIQVADGTDRFAACEAGIAASSCESLLLLGAGVFVAARGWVGELARLLAPESDAVAISPTMLYEDMSVRFAGLPVEAGAAGATRAFVGYGRDWLRRQPGPVQRVQAVTSECCLMRKRAFLSVGGFARDFVAAEFKCPDLSLRLRQAGHALLWAPQVEAFAIDEAAPAPAELHWHKAGRMVDRWEFDRRWSARSVETRGAA